MCVFVFISTMYHLELGQQKRSMAVSLLQTKLSWYTHIDTIRRTSTLCCAFFQIHYEKPTKLVHTTNTRAIHNVPGEQKEHYKMRHIFLQALLEQQQKPQPRGSRKFRMHIQQQKRNLHHMQHIQTVTYY